MAIRQELQAFLKAELQLALSMEKTQVTHLNDGFKFLGFWIQRAVGMSGKRAPRILIPDEARRRFLDKMKQALAPATTHASVQTKILGLNRIINGWGRYYQYTSSPKYVFSGLDHQVFWMMAHWLGRKYKCSMPHVMRKFYGQHTLRTPTITLKRLDHLATRRYKVRVIPNPYTQTDHSTIWREDDFSLDYAWAGCERRPGQADWRDLVLERDGTACALCGRTFSPWELELDHRKPVARFQRVKDAEYPENLQMLCTSCHRNKTRQDRQVLSRVR